MKRKPVRWAEALKQMFSPVRKKRPAAARLRAEQLDERIVPNSYTITDGGDTAASGVLTQLRSAITDANANTDATNTITLATDVLLARANATGQENANSTGDLDIVSATTKTYIIQSSAGNHFTIDAAALDRVFQIIGTNVTVLFKNVTITGGVAVDDGTAGALPGSTDAKGGVSERQASTPAILRRVV